jgi:uncharacterized protein with FMN-binding domain
MAARIFAQRALKSAHIAFAGVWLGGLVSTFKPWGRFSRRFDVDPKKLRIAVAALATLGIAFGVFNYATLRSQRNMPIPRATAEALDDGTYPGVAACDFDYAVSVRVERGAIAAIDVVNTRDSHYARFAEGVLTRTVDAQRTDVDAITGATTTSRCLSSAVANALVSARKH